MSFIRVLLCLVPYFLFDAEGDFKTYGMAAAIFLIGFAAILSRLIQKKNPYAGTAITEQSSGFFFLLAASLTLVLRHGLSLWFPLIFTVQLIFLMVVRGVRRSDDLRVRFFLLTDGLTSLVLAAMLLSAAWEGVWPLTTTIGMVLILALSGTTLLGAAVAAIYGVFRLNGAFRFKKPFPSGKKSPLLPPVPATVFLVLAALAFVGWDFFLNKTPSAEMDLTSAPTLLSLPPPSPADQAWVNETLSPSPLELGPALGRVTPTSVRIWAAAQSEANFTAVIYKNGVEAARAPLVIAAAADLSGFAEIQGLEPSTTYSYTVLDDKGAVAVAAELLPYCRFHTFPAEGTKGVTLRYALTSCNRPLEESPDYYSGKVLNERFVMFEALSRQNQVQPFDFVLMLGDQVYNDIPYAKSLPTPQEMQKINADPALKSTKAALARKLYRDNYVRSWSHPSYRKMAASVPAFMLEDDHDTRDGWGSETTDDQAPAQFVRAQSFAVYQSFQAWADPNPYPGKPYFAFNFGDVGFFVPDLRSDRDVARTTDAYPLLGPDQTRDLDAWMEGPAKNKKVLFFGLSIPIADAPQWVVDWLSYDLNGSGDDFRDRWTYSVNRPELGRFLDKGFSWMKATGGRLFTLGGDTHTAMLGRIRPPQETGLNPIFEFTSSGISNFDKAAQSSWPIFQKLFGQNETVGRKITVERILTGLNYGVVQVQPRDGGYGVSYNVAVQASTSPDTVTNYHLFDSLPGTNK